MARVQVNLGERAYPIIVESGLLTRLADVLKHEHISGKLMLVIDARIADSHGATALGSLRQAGLDVATCLLHAHEQQKTLQAANELYRALASARMERSSTIVALGGGIVGDIAGFAAATYLRGVSLVHVPSTLLAMVDASIGGKTAVNLLTGHHQLLKNIIGAFWQPRAVLIDPTLLHTLDPRDFRCGLAECVKHGMIADRELLDFMKQHSARINQLDEDAIEPLIVRSARIKATIVEEDERESGRRALLNLGHTFGHAIESCLPDEVKHGEAVAIGLVAAMHCAVQRGTLAPHEQRVILDLLTAFDLPIRLPSSIEADHLLTAMQSDKKVRSGHITLIIPQGLGNASIVHDIERSHLLDAWQAVGARIVR